MSAPKDSKHQPIAAPSGADAYDVRERIAIGTAGTVYRAVQQGTGAEVLFKVVQGEDVENPLDVQCILKRRATLQAIKHPHVAELLDVFDDEEGCVLVYSYVVGKGANLGPLDHVYTATDALNISRQLSSALLAGEKKGLPHGELKPSNIVVSRNQRSGPHVQVQDWGLSECRRSNPPHESLLFMAPERLYGAKATFASDMFSLGATLVFLITGHVPVQGDNRDELLAAWKTFKVEDMIEHRPDLDASLIKWIGRLLRLNPRDRFSTVAKAVKALEDGLNEDDARLLSPSVPTTSSGAITQPLHHGSTEPASTTFGPTTFGPSGQPTRRQARPKRYYDVKGFTWKLAKFGVIWPALLATAIFYGKRYLPQLSDWRPGDILHAPTAANGPQPQVGPSEPAVAALEPFTYPPNTPLDKANGGSGWASDWKATNVFVGQKPGQNRPFAMLGVGGESQAKRTIATPKQLADTTIAMAMTLWYPPEEGPIMVVDLFDGSPNGAPAMISQSQSEVKIYIIGGKGEVRVPSARSWKLVVAYTFKKSGETDTDVDITLMVDPDPATGQPVAGKPACKRTLKSVTIPENLALTMKTRGISRQDCDVSDLRIGGSIVEVLR